MAENYNFSVILEPQAGGGFTVLVPALPEVVTEGDTEAEALANARKRSAPFLRIGATTGLQFRRTPAPKFAASRSRHDMAPARLPVVSGLHAARALARAGFVVDRLSEAIMS